MYSLAIDSASALGGIALTKGSETLAHLSLKGRLTHAENLLPEVESLLERAGLSLADLKVLGVVLGPGSFTGVRIGVATVMGLARGLNIPAYGISTLRALALAFPFAARPLCPLLDLRRGQIYGALFDTSGGDPVPLIPEGHYDLDELISQLPPALLCLGHGALQAQDALRVGGGEGLALMNPVDIGGLAPLVAAWAGRELSRGAPSDASTLTPSYLQASAAEKGRS